MNRFWSHSDLFSLFFSAFIVARCLGVVDDMVDTAAIDLKHGALNTPVVANQSSSSSSSADVSFVPLQPSSLLSPAGADREHKDEPVVPAVPEHSQSQPGTALSMLPIVAPCLLSCLAYFFYYVVCFTCRCGA
jgi:hypothetical protein